MYIPFEFYDNLLSLVSVQCCWIGAAIGAVGSIVGGLLSKKSKNNTNAVNLQIAREQNETNKEIARYNNEYNYKMQQEQNAYNSPEAQMQRYKDAGVNPYMALNNMTAGNQEQQLTASDVQQNQLPSMMDENETLNDTIINSATTFADLALKSQEIKGKKIENDYSEQTIADRVALVKKELDEKGYNNRLLRVNAENAEYQQEQGINDMVLARARAEINQLDAHSAQLNAEKQYKEALIGLTDKQGKQLDKYLNEKFPVEVANLRKQGKVLDEQYFTEKSKQALNYAGVRYNDAQVQQITRLLEYNIAAQDLANQSAALAVEEANETSQERVQGEKRYQASRGYLPNNVSTSGDVTIGASKIKGGIGVNTSYTQYVQPDDKDGKGNKYKANDYERNHGKPKKRMVTDKHGRYLRYE